MILAGDIGGTQTRFALFEAGQPRAAFEVRYESGDYAGFGLVLERFVADARAALGGLPSIETACLGVAGPVSPGRVELTNLAWVIDAAEVARCLDVERVALINDFAAIVHGLENLGEGDLATLQAGEPAAGAPRVVLGAGTGLGIAYAVASPGGGYRPIPGEGGHGAFAPANDEQAALWKYLHERVGRVTLEHLLSGAGLRRVYEFVLARGGSSESAPLRAELAATVSAEPITRHALEHGDPLALAALDLLIACYGAAAGDHALNVLARGGVFIAGGIVARILARLSDGGFIAAFNDKAAFSGHARRMPVHAIVNERVGLQGAAAFAARTDSGAAAFAARTDSGAAAPAVRTTPP